MSDDIASAGTHQYNALAGALADRYRIERILGEGGMATVYLAHDLKHDRKVALKVLKPELGAVLGAERFLSEIKVTAQLQHPNLLPLFDSGDANGLLYYVMPFVEGETLRHRLDRERQLSVGAAVGIATGVTFALAYAHERGVIHRDLKPENILFQAGQPVVADFGIALAVSNAGGTRATQTGLALGTPQYMSPEQAVGDRAIDARSDIYSLASVLYEMLAGEPPHAAPSAQAVIIKIITDPARPIQDLRKNVPPNVAAAVTKALEKLPADRFETAREFGEALANPSFTTSNASAAMSQSKVAVRLWKLATAAASVVALTTLGLFATTRGGDSSRVVRTRARFVLELPDSARMNRALSAAALSRDGTMLVYETREPTVALFVRRLDGLTPRRVAGTEGAESPKFSPDGRSIGFILHNSIVKVPIEGGTPTVIVADSVLGPVFAWLDGGTILFDRIGANGKETVWKVSDAGGGGTAVPLTTVKADEQRHYMPNRLPGGRLALLAIQTGAGATAPNEIAVVRVADGTVTRLGIKGVVPTYADGFLFYVKPDRSYAAVPFDAAHGRVTGEPIPISDTGLGTIAENGTMLFYPTSSAMELVSVDRHGGDARRLLAETRPFFYPRLSPDGRHVLVGIGGTQLSRAMWVIDLGSGTLTQISPSAYTLPDGWTPDGRRVMWTHGGNEPALWWQPWDGSAPAEKLLDGAQGARLLPGGRELLTTLVRRGGGREFRIVPLPIDTLRWSKPLDLRRTPGVSSARLSPDGKWIAYIDEQSSVTEVFVYARASGGRYQVSVGGGVEPLWSRDGKELFYRAPQRGLMSAHLELGADARVVKRDTLFPIGFAAGGVQPNYDVTADGRFIIPRPIAVSEWPIVVIGWTDELREQRRGANPK